MSGQKQVKYKLGKFLLKPKIYWGNESTLKPKSAIPIDDTWVTKQYRKISWEIPGGFGHITIEGYFNYAHLEDAYYHLEIADYFGNNRNTGKPLYQYKVIRDIGCTDVVGKHGTVNGTLLITDNKGLVEDNIHLTSPIVTTGDSLAHIEIAPDKGIRKDGDLIHPTKSLITYDAISEQSVEKLHDFLNKTIDDNYVTFPAGISSEIKYDHRKKILDALTEGIENNKDELVVCAPDGRNPTLKTKFVERLGTNDIVVIAAQNSYNQIAKSKLDGYQIKSIDLSNAEEISLLSIDKVEPKEFSSKRYKEIPDKEVSETLKKDLNLNEYKKKITPYITDSKGKREIKYQNFHFGQIKNEGEILKNNQVVEIKDNRVYSDEIQILVDIKDAKTIEDGSQDLSDKYRGHNTGIHLMKGEMLFMNVDIESLSPNKHGYCVMPSYISQKTILGRGEVGTINYNGSFDGMLQLHYIKITPMDGISTVKQPKDNEIIRSSIPTYKEFATSSSIVNSLDEVGVKAISKNIDGVIKGREKFPLLSKYIKKFIEIEKDKFTEIDPETSYTYRYDTNKIAGDAKNDITGRITSTGKSRYVGLSTGDSKKQRIRDFNTINENALAHCICSYPRDINLQRCSKKGKKIITTKVNGDPNYKNLIGAIYNEKLNEGSEATGEVGSFVKRTKVHAFSVEPFNTHGKSNVSKSLVAKGIEYQYNNPKKFFTGWPNRARYGDNAGNGTIGTSLDITGNQQVNVIGIHTVNGKENGKDYISSSTLLSEGLLDGDKPYEDDGRPRYTEVEIDLYPTLMGIDIYKSSQGSERNSAPYGELVNVEPNCGTDAISVRLIKMGKGTYYYFRINMDILNEESSPNIDVNHFPQRIKTTDDTTNTKVVREFLLDRGNDEVVYDPYLRKDSGLHRISGTRNDKGNGKPQAIMHAEGSNHYQYSAQINEISVNQDSTGLGFFAVLVSLGEIQKKNRSDRRIANNNMVSKYNDGTPLSINNQFKELLADKTELQKSYSTHVPQNETVSAFTTIKKEGVVKYVVTSKNADFTGLRPITEITNPDIESIPYGNIEDLRSQGNVHQIFDLENTDYIAIATKSATSDDPNGELVLRGTSDTLHKTNVEANYKLVSNIKIDDVDQIINSDASVNIYGITIPLQIRQKIDIYDDLREESESKYFLKFKMTDVLQKGDDETRNMYPAEVKLLQIKTPVEQIETVIQGNKDIVKVSNMSSLDVLMLVEQFKLSEQMRKNEMDISQVRKQEISDQRSMYQDGLAHRESGLAAFGDYFNSTFRFFSNYQGIPSMKEHLTSGEQGIRNEINTRSKLADIAGIKSEMSELRESMLNPFPQRISRYADTSTPEYFKDGQKYYTAYSSLKPATQAKYGSAYEYTKFKLSKPNPVGKKGEKGVANYDGSPYYNRMVEAANRSASSARFGTPIDTIVRGALSITSAASNIAQTYAERTKEQASLKMQIKYPMEYWTRQNQKLQIAHRQNELKERYELMKAANMYATPDIEEGHLKRYINEIRNLPNMHLRLTYSKDAILDKIKKYYFKYGYGLKLPNQKTEGNPDKPNVRVVKYEDVNYIKCNELEDNDLLPTALIYNAVKETFIQGFRVIQDDESPDEF